MAVIYWPPANPAADDLLASYLDKVAPDWRSRDMIAVSGNQVMELLWGLIPLSNGAPPSQVTPTAEIAFDVALERVAGGEAPNFDRLEPGARNVLHSRLIVALTGALATSAEDRSVMQIPDGLGKAERLRAVMLRLLYQAAPSIGQLPTGAGTA